MIIKGKSGVGKTVLVVNCAIKAQEPFTQLINSDRFLGLNEHQIMHEIHKIFEDA